MKNKDVNKINSILLLFFWLFVWGCTSGSADHQVYDLSAKQAAALIEKHRDDADFTILDIRTPAEFRQGHIAGAINIDFYDKQFRSKLAALDNSKSFLVYCRSGNRSRRAQGIFHELGFVHLYHLNGGVIDWQANALPLSAGH